MSSASRTNLTSTNVTLHKTQIVGVGSFRIAYAGTYVGGNRNQQEAVCKVFKQQYRLLEAEFFLSDFEVADRSIQLAEQWNNFCQRGKEILITKGDVMQIGKQKYMVEPLIRYFSKFTSNNGWIGDVGMDVLAMEAFSHFTYHKTGGSMIVCDLQGRYRDDPYSSKRCRFELTDVAICSRRRKYGPTDLGEKGIESFFANHQCNEFCHADGLRWSRPRNAKRWFDSNSNTSMLRSSASDLLQTQNRARFTATLDPIFDFDSDDDSSM